MTPFERLFWQRLQRRVATMQPDVARAILRAFESLRAELSGEAFTDLIARGGLGVDQRLDDDVMARAFADLRRTILTQTVDGVNYHARDIPGAGRGPERLGIAFDVLNPRMVDAIRTLNTKVIQGLTDDVRATVRQVVQRGLETGTNPRTIARDLRSAIGLGPTQEQQVANFRRALEQRDAKKAFTYLKRDRRSDGKIARGQYTDADIERWVDVYRKRRIALNAETHARTAALDAQKQAQRLAWESAIDRGIVQRTDLMKRWVGTLDDRERPEHVAMEGETVGFDEPWSNGQNVPGDTEYNCRCVARYATTIKRQPGRGRTTPAPRQRVAAIVTAPPVIPEPTATVAGPALRAERLAAEERRIAALPIEHAYVLADDGTVLLAKSGNRNSVGFNGTELARMRNGTLTHNHPAGSWGLSDADVRLAIETNLAEMRAVTRDQVSSLLRPDGGWDRTWRQTQVAMRAAMGEVRDAGVVAVAEGRLTLDEANRRFWFDVWSIVARRFDWVFTSTPR